MELTEITKLTQDMFNGLMLIISILQVILPVTLLDTVAISELFNLLFLLN